MSLVSGQVHMHSTECHQLPLYTRPTLANKTLQRCIIALVKDLRNEA